MSNMIGLAPVRYAVAAVAAGLALLLQVLLIPLFGVSPDASPFMMFFAAVMVAAWFGGLGSGLLATALSAGLSYYYFLDPQYSFQLKSLGQELRLAVFSLEGVFISWLAAMMHTARERAEEAVNTHRRSEERFRLLVEGAKDYAIFMLDPEGRVSSWNTGAERLLGYREVEIVGQHFSLLFTPEDARQGAPERELRRAADEGRAEDERWHVRKDGTRFWASGVVTPLTDGVLRGFSKVMRDHTERKRAEEALRVSETRFRTMVEQSPLSVQILSPDGRTLRVNRAWEELWGVTLDDIAGYNLLEDQQLVDKGIMPYILRGFAGEPTRIPPIAYDPEESIPDLTSHEKPVRWVQAFIYPVKDAAGDIREVVLMHEDITEREEAEEALRQAEEKYRGIFENAVDGIFQTAMDGRLLAANPAMAGIFGYEAPEEMMLSVTDVERQLYADPVRRAEVARLMREQGVVSGLEVQGRRKDGSLAWFSINARAVRDADGELVGIEGTVEDVTERRLKEDALRFLAEAGAELSSSLDYRETLAGVASLAVPRLADWCAIDIVEEDGSLSRLAVAHQDPEKIRWAHELQERYPPDPDAPYGVPQILRTGEPELMPEIPESMLDEIARDEEYRRIIREIGLNSYIGVPLVARGRTLGAITLVSAESGRRYEQADLELAEDLSRRAALAVDNSRLYEEAKKEIAERELAEEELRSSRDQLEIILRGVTDGVTAQDEYGRLVYANEAAARICGYPSAQALLEAPPQEVLQKFEITDESGRPFPLTDLPGRRALRGERSSEILLRFRAVATDEERWAAISASPVYDERGRVRFVVSIFRDVTEQRRTEEALREVREAERNRLARDLHDGALQDLTYALAEAQLVQVLSEEPDLGHRLERVVGALKRAGQELRGAVHDLRSGEAHNRPFPEALESLVESSRRMAPDCDIRLTVEEGFPTTPLGETGAELLRIFQEALTNARRHSGAGNLRVRLGLEENELVAEIEDNGRGFGPGAASGVGLGSMQERAAALGGELEVESEPGRGTKVRLRAPLRA